jgi:hypothetical protein
MRRLIAITAIGFLFGFSTFSIASDYMALYTGQTANSETRDNVDGGKIEKDLMSFYFTPKGTEGTGATWTGTKTPDDGGYIVFGVLVPRDKSS